MDKILFKEVINMFGYGRYGNRNRRRINLYPKAYTQGYTYIGPCRCGFGPDAYYMDKSGRILHVNEVLRDRFLPTRVEEDLRTELAWLKEQKAELDKRLQEIEEKLKKEKI